MSNELEEIAQTVNAVSSMEPYIELLAGDSPQKAKMATYALNKLNLKELERRNFQHHRNGSQGVK